VREQRGVAVLVQPRLTGRRAVRVRELVAEAGPRVDVDQHLGEVDLRKSRGDLTCQCGRGLRTLGAGQPTHVKLAVLNVDRDVARRERPIQRGDPLIDVAGELPEALARGRWQPQRPMSGLTSGRPGG
jgi:hypothetical protein